MPQITSEEKGAYDFGPDEPAVVCIEMLPHRYVTINGDTLCLGKETVLKEGKMVRQWTHEPDGRMWVPSRLIGPLTQPQGKDDRRLNLAPLAQVIGSRTAEEWKNGVDPLQQPAEAEEAPPASKTPRRRLPEGE